VAEIFVDIGYDHTDELSELISVLNTEKTRITLDFIGSLPHER